MFHVVLVTADDLLCIVMEFCGGGDVLQRIRVQKTTHFSVDNVLYFSATFHDIAQLQFTV